VVQMVQLKLVVYGFIRSIQSLQWANSVKNSSSGLGVLRLERYFSTSGADRRPFQARRGPAR
jgi:hypothetical protein